MDKLKEYLLATTCLIILAGVLALSSETRAQGPHRFIPGPPCGVSPVRQRFVVSQDGMEVCDNATGFVWEQEPDSPEDIQQVAIDHCANQSGEGWTLPTIGQMVTLLDRTNAQPALPTNHLFSVLHPNSRYWTSSVAVTNPLAGWNVALGSGSVGTLDIDTFNGFAWCIRNGSP